MITLTVYRILRGADIACNVMYPWARQTGLDVVMSD